jgi:hypothetical protein
MKINKDKKMNCPYDNCQNNDINSRQQYCQSCYQPIFFCKQCNQPNRNYAVYCTNCGKNIPPNKYDCLSFKGGLQRTNLNHFKIAKNFDECSVTPQKTIQLDSACISILVYNYYLFLFSFKGEIRIINLLNNMQQVQRFNADDKIYADPAISEGTLYVGTRRSISAYSIPAILSEENISTEPRWTIPLQNNEVPMKAMVPIGERLYFNIKINSQYQKICAINNIKTGNPDPIIQINAGPGVSSIAGNWSEKSKKIFFFSETKNNITLHTADHRENKSPKIVSKTIHNAPSGCDFRIPIASIGRKVFVTFKHKETLYRIDSDTGDLDQKICENVKEYALANANSAFVVNSKGLYFHGTSRQQIDLSKQRLSVKIAPYILNNCAVLAGLQNGTVQIYNYFNPTSYPKNWDISDRDNVAITSLVAYQNILIAGNQEGTVKLAYWD